MDDVAPRLPPVPDDEIEAEVICRKLIAVYGVGHPSLIKWLKTAISRWPYSVSLNRIYSVFLGISERGAPSSEERIDALHAVVNGDPTDYDSWCTLGTLAHMSGQFELALEYLQTAVRIAEDEHAFIWLALTLASLGQSEQAVKWLEPDRCRFSENAEVVFYRNQIQEGKFGPDD